MTIRVRDVVEMKEKKNNHQEDGECGCKYLDENCPCEVDVNGYNEALKEIGSKEIDLKKLSLKEGDIILCRRNLELTRILQHTKRPEGAPKIPIIPVADFDDIKVIEVDMEKLAELLENMIPIAPHEEFFDYRKRQALTIASNLKEILKEKKI